MTEYEKLKDLREHVAAKQAAYRADSKRQERFNCKDAAYVAKMQAEALGDVLTAIDRVMQ